MGSGGWVRRGEAGLRRVSGGRREDVGQKVEGDTTFFWDAVSSAAEATLSTACASCAVVPSSTVLQRSRRVRLISGVRAAQRKRRAREKSAALERSAPKTAAPPVCTCSQRRRAHPLEVTDALETCAGGGEARTRCA